MKTLGIARMALAWTRGASVLGYPPAMVAIEPTNVCNLRCTFCSQSNPERRAGPTGYMSVERLEWLLDWIQQGGGAWLGRVSLTHDGEPLLHPLFPEFVRRVGRRGWRARFSTNALFLDRARAEELEAGGPFSVDITFSGDPDLFERHRGRAGDWETVRRNVADLIELSNRSPRVRVELKEIAAWADPPRSRESLERMRAVLPRPANGRVAFRPMSVHASPGSLLSPPGHRTGVRRRCPYPWSQLNLAWNGEVHACCRDLEGKTVLGNAFETQSLWDVWNGEPYQALRRRIAAGEEHRIAACRDCDMPWSGHSEGWSARNILHTLRER